MVRRRNAKRDESEGECVDRSCTGVWAKQREDRTRVLLDHSARLSNMVSRVETMQKHCRAVINTMHRYLPIFKAKMTSEHVSSRAASRPLTIEHHEWQDRVPRGENVGMCGYERTCSIYISVISLLRVPVSG